MKIVEEYKNKAGVVFREGDKVSLVKGAFTTRDPLAPTFAGLSVTRGKITSLFPDHKGFVVVEPRLGGYWTWNVNDLIKRSR